MQKGKVLALDYGKSRIGLASGDLSLKIASPVEVLSSKNLDFAISKILDFCVKWEVKIVVVGLPLSMNEDQSSEMKKSVEYFVDKFKKAIKISEVEHLGDIKIVLFDERLSSFEADGLMREAGKSGKDRREYRDSFAALVILQRFFDSIEK
ncbi:MAG: Holliday junction resolvase RuvX [Candidatus Gracilibacteria bacterium]|nr:Holliday junction resolvase RuvX [Candidatus Gracilibacteria bacterium]